MEDRKTELTNTCGLKLQKKIRSSRDWLAFPVDMLDGGTEAQEWQPVIFMGYKDQFVLCSFPSGVLDYSRSVRGPVRSAESSPFLLHWKQHSLVFLGKALALCAHPKRGMCYRVAIRVLIALRILSPSATLELCASSSTGWCNEPRDKQLALLDIIGSTLNIIRDEKEDGKGIGEVIGQVVWTASFWSDVLLFCAENSSHVHDHRVLMATLFTNGARPSRCITLKPTFADQDVTLLLEYGCLEVESPAQRFRAVANAKAPDLGALSSDMKYLSGWYLFSEYRERKVAVSVALYKSSLTLDMIDVITRYIAWWAIALTIEQEILCDTVKLQAQQGREIARLKVALLQTPAK